MRIRNLFLIGALIATGATMASAKEGATDSRQARAEAKLAKALDGRVAGKPVSCINLREIRSSQIYDRTAILYEVGSKLYLNRPEGASTLDSDDILVTKTYGTQLCDIDTVRLVDRTTRIPAGFVSLNEFVPYTKVASK